MSTTSKAAKKRMLSLPRAVRSQMMSKMARARWDNVSPEDRKKIARTLVECRRKKSKN